MKKILPALLTLSITLFANTITTQNSVVKIFTSASIPDYKYPWQTSKIVKFTGSGAIIKNNQILTSAHVVSNARFIEIKKENDPNKYLAEIKFVSHQADLALLEVQDKDFFQNTKPLTITESIKHRDEVTVLGYPMGGNAISTTTGVVSRIEYNSYVWSKEILLSIQIDAAINGGNSGGPAINNSGELIGIAMQKLKDSSNIGYIVPSMIINTFLEDIKDNKVDGFFKDTTTAVDIENQQIKEYYGLSDGKGVLVTYTDYYEKDLMVDDIILSIDNKDIANNGTIQTKYGRVSFIYPLHKKQIGDAVKLKVLRDKKIIEINYTVKRQTPLINTEFNKEPRYLIFGGLVFTPLTENYLTMIGMKADAINTLFYKKTKTDEFLEPVVWMQTIFPHNINRGYSSGSFVVENVNGTKIKSFAHFVDVIDNVKSKYVVIDFIERKKVILNVEDAKKSFEDLKRIYYLNDDRQNN